MHKSYRLGENLSHQTQIFCWITETPSQPIQGYLPSPGVPLVFLRLDVISRCRGGRREGCDPQCNESTHASPGIGSPCPRPLSQASHWWAVPCSWWHGLFMSTYFLCSFHAVLESLRIILLLPAKLEPWNCGKVICGLLCNTQHFFSGTLLPSCPGAGFLTEIITWETQGLACS